MNLANNIKKFRAEAGFTQEELAAKLSLSPQAVSKWERGESLPDTALLPEISRVLGVSLDRLFGQKSASLKDILPLIDSYLGSLPEKERIAQAFKLVCYCEDSSCGWNPGSIDISAFELVSPPEYCSVCNESENGFVYSSLRSELPFSMLCLEPENGFGAALGPDEKYRVFFERLSDRKVLGTQFALLKKKPLFAFDAEYARIEFGLDEPEATLGKLEGVVLRTEVHVIDGVETKIWTFYKDFGIIALFCILNERTYSQRRFAYQSDHRYSPYLK